MREGRDGDDIFIMVEDEFQTVAQSYTAHLHHAEYKRLVKQAREAGPKALPEPTSPMTAQAKRRLKSAALQKKQKVTLKQVMGQVPTEEEEEEEDNVVDLWSGTSLAPLMANSSQQKRSLIGLERMSSSTKAGLRISRGQMTRKDIEDGEDDDDIDLETRSRNTPLNQSEGVVVGTRSTSRPLSREASVQRRPSAVRARTEKGAVTQAPRSLSEPDEDAGRPERVSRGEAGLRQSRPRSRPTSNGLLKRKKDKEQEKKSRLDEVPMFMI